MKSLVGLIVLVLFVEQVIVSNITLTKNSPYSAHINKGQKQEYLFTVEQKWFDKYDKVNLRVLVSNFVNVQMYSGDECGKGCVTNDRLKLITDNLIIYKENVDQDLQFKIDVTSKNNYNYRITIITRFDQHPHSISIINDQIALKGMIASDSINYYDFKLKEQNYFEINLKTENDYQNNYLDIMVGVKTQEGFLPKFIDKQQIIKKGKKQLIVSTADKGYEKNKEYIIGVKSKTYNYYMRNVEIHYSIEVNTQDHLRFISLNHEYRLHQGPGTKVNYQVYIGDIRDVLVLSFYEIQKTKVEGLKVQLVSDLVTQTTTFPLHSHEQVSTSQMEQLCQQQLQDCTLYLQVTSTAQHPSTFVMGLLQLNMPIRLLTNQKLLLDLQQLITLHKKTFYYVPDPQQLHNLELHVDSPLDAGLNLKYAFIKDIGLNQINQYLHNKIDEKMNSMENQHTTRIQLDQKTLQDCHPYCLLVVVASLAPGSHQTHKGQWVASLQMVQGPLELQLNSQYNIHLKANATQTMYVNTEGMYEQEKALFINYQQQLGNAPPIRTAVDFSRPNGLITTNNHSLLFHSNQLAFSPNQLQHSPRLRLTLSTHTSTSFILSISSLFINYVFPKDLHQFDITHSHKNSFMFLNTLNVTALKIKIIEDPKYDYSAMVVKIKKCDNKSQCDKDARTTLIVINQDNEFIFENLNLVGNNIQMFTYYQIEFDLVRTDLDEMKGLFYIDESPTDYQRLFMNHQHIQKVQQAKEINKFNLKFYQGYIFSYKVRLNIKQGDPRMTIIYQDHHSLKQEQINNALRNNGIFRQKQGQNYLLTYIDEYLATLAFRHQQYKHKDNTHYFNNVKEIDLPIYVQCTQNCSYTLEVTDQSKQQLRFNQVYKASEGVFDNKTSLRLTRNDENKNKHVYMYIGFKGEKGNSLEELELNVMQFNKMENKRSGQIVASGYEVVFRSKEFMEVRLPAITRDFYQVSFNNKGDDEVVFNLEHEVMLLPLHRELNRHIEGKASHKYIFENAWTEGVLKVRLVKCQGIMEYTFSEEQDKMQGEYANHLGIYELVDGVPVFREYGKYLALEGQFTYQVSTQRVDNPQLELTVVNLDHNSGFYKVYLSFHPSGQLDLQSLLTPSNLTVQVQQAFNGQMEASVQPIRGCTQQGCNQYDLSKMKVDYEFILTHQQDLLNTVGHCRFQLEEAQLFHSQQSSSGYVLSPQLTAQTKYSRVESTRFQSRHQTVILNKHPNSKQQVKEYFQIVGNNSMLLVTATVSNVFQLDRNGVTTLLEPIHIQYDLQVNNQLVLTQQHLSPPPSSQSSHQLLYFFILATAFIFLLLIFLFRRQHTINALNHQKLQNQIHQIRADEYVSADQALNDKQHLKDTEIPPIHLKPKDQYTEL